MIIRHWDGDIENSNNNDDGDDDVFETPTYSMNTETFKLVSLNAKNNWFFIQFDSDSDVESHILLLDSHTFGFQILIGII